MSIVLCVSDRTSNMSKTTQLIIMPVKTCHFMQKICSCQKRHFRIENKSIIGIKDLHQVIYAPNKNYRGSKYQLDVQNPRGIRFYPYYHCTNKICLNVLGSM